MWVIAKIQMEKWNSIVLDINETVEQLGLRKCSQLFVVHALSDSDMVSYTIGKVKQSELNILEIYIPGLNEVLGQLGTTHDQLKATTDTFFLPLYEEKSSVMDDGCARFYCSSKKPPPLKKLPPTDSNLQLHVFQAQLQMLL